MLVKSCDIKKEEEEEEKSQYMFASCTNIYWRYGMNMAAKLGMAIELVMALWVSAQNFLTQCTLLLWNKGDEALKWEKNTFDLLWML